MERIGQTELYVQTELYAHIDSKKLPTDKSYSFSDAHFKYTMAPGAVTRITADMEKDTSTVPLYESANTAGCRVSLVPELQLRDGVISVYDAESQQRIVVATEKSLPVIAVTRVTVDCPTN